MKHEKGKKLSPLTGQQPEAKLDTLCLMRKLDLSYSVVDLLLHSASTQLTTANYYQTTEKKVKTVKVKIL